MEGLESIGSVISALGIGSDTSYCLSYEGEELSERKARERSYCEKCEGIEECQYAEMGNRGFEPIWERWEVSYPFVKECKQRVRWARKVASAREYGESGLPAEHRALDLEGYECTDGNIEALIGLERLLRGEIKGLHLIGGARAGKTRLVSAFGNSLLKRNISVKYLSVVEMLVKLRYDSERYEERLEGLQRVPSLIIEDVGSERASEYNREQVELVLSGRRRLGRMTVITSRTGAEGIAGRYASEGRIREELKAMSEIEIY